MRDEYDLRQPQATESRNSDCRPEQSLQLQEVGGERPERSTAVPIPLETFLAATGHTVEEDLTYGHNKLE